MLRISILLNSRYILQKHKIQSKLRRKHKCANCFLIPHFDGIMETHGQTNEIKNVLFDCCFTVLALEIENDFVILFLATQF